MCEAQKLESARWEICDRLCRLQTIRAEPQTQGRRPLDYVANRSIKDLGIERSLDLQESPEAPIGILGIAIRIEPQLLLRGRKRKLHQLTRAQHARLRYRRSEYE